MKQVLIRRKALKNSINILSALRFILGNNYIGFGLKYLAPAAFSNLLKPFRFCFPRSPINRHK
jgi:hypothetical protein